MVNKKTKFMFFIGMGTIFLMCVLVAFAAVSPSRVKAYSLYDSQSLYAQPSIIAAPESLDELALLKNDIRPASVLLLVDSELNVINKAGDVLGELGIIYTEYIKGKIMPVIEPVSGDAAQALLTFLGFDGEDDLAVIVSDTATADILKNLSARIYYRAGTVTSQTDCLDIIAVANAVKAQTLILSANSVNERNVRYIQARFKCVWADTVGDPVEVAGALSAGVYGIIAPTAKSVLDVYSLISTIGGGYDGLPPVLFSRAPFNVSHRGSRVGGYYDNTLGAIAEADAFGATHVEIDIRLTKDGEIVLMHDEQLGNSMRTDSGAPAMGTVSGSTLERLESYVMKDGKSKVATLDEVFFQMKYSLKNLDLIAVIEIKSLEPELIDELKILVEKHDIADRVLIISFYVEQLERAGEKMPHIPSSLLLGTMSHTDAISRARAVNAGVDMSIENIGTYYPGSSVYINYNTLFRAFADRGYSVWMWTFAGGNMTRGVNFGVTGITTDMTEYLLPYGMTLNVKDEYKVSSLPKIGDKMDIEVFSYNGNTYKRPGIVLPLKTEAETLTAVFIYTYENEYNELEMGLVSRPVVFVIGKEGCGSALAGGSGSFVLIALAMCVIILKRRKKRCF